MNNIEKLPEVCYSILKSTGDIIVIKRGESGYYKTDIPNAGVTESKYIVAEKNGLLGVTVAQQRAMEVGSMFGWDVPAADPDNYDENGNLK